MTLRTPRGIVFRPTLVCIAVAACFAAGTASANPVGPAVVAGQATFSAVGSSLTVTNTPNAIINWQGFSIGTGEVTRFVQQSAQSAVLNRVVGQDPSAILGTLTSNGHVYLINPNGILFGQGSRVDVAGLVASTLNISNQDFLQGKLNFEAGAVAGSLVNQGNIVTASGGRVLLLAPDVQNHGVVSAPNGEVVLAAGKSVQLVEADLPQLKVEVASGGEALNVGEIIAEGGKIGVYAGLINQRGIVRADSVSRDATGRIVFKASDTTLLEEGSVTSAAGAKGGTIQVLGDKVGLTGDAKVDASGDAGGGTVLVGGDYQGKNADVQNAFRTYVGKDTSIKADANVAGDGGKVIVWSDDATRAYGSISARGGAQGGDGGLVETSGHYLDATRAPDVGAPKGTSGTWLLDPWNITISSAADQNTSDTDTSADYNFAGSASPSVVSVSTITTALATGSSVRVTTSGSGAEQGNITVDAPITTTQTTSASLTLNATNDIQSNANISLGSEVSLYFYAGNSVSAGSLGARYVYASAGTGSLTTGAITANAGGVSLQSALALQPGTVNSIGSVYLRSSGAGVAVPSITTQGNVTIYSYADLMLTNTINAGAGIDLYVQRPGGLFTMAAGSSLDLGTTGFDVYLQADDMVLGGSINAPNGYVQLDPYSSSRNVYVGPDSGARSLNLSLAELQTITTSDLRIGNYSYYGGDLTVAMPIASTDLGVSRLYLEGHRVTTGDISMGGELNIYSYGDITTGNLSTNYVYLNASGSGAVTTGTVTATQSVTMYAQASIKPGTITAGDSVYLNSYFGGITVPNITTTAGYIDIYAHDDLTLSGTLTATYGVDIAVQRPGGVLTMLSGSSIAPNTGGAGYSSSLRADDMVLAGTLDTGNGYVYLNPYTNGRSITVGTTPVAGTLSLSPTELQTITANTLEIGSYYSDGGDLTVSSALNTLNLNVTNLRLEGHNVTTGDLTVAGNLYIYGYSDVATGNLSAATLNVYAYGGGRLTTGTIDTTSTAYLYAEASLMPGTINSQGSVTLDANYGSIVLPNVTAAGSLTIRSFDDLTIASTLSSASSMTIDVEKSGGMLTTTSAATVGAGSALTLRADDMTLAGSLSAGANGTMFLYPYHSGRDTVISSSGGIAGALNLSVSELALLSAATLDIRAGTYGNLTVSEPITGLTANNLYLRGQHIALGAGITVGGNLYAIASRNIDANTTSSDITLTAGNSSTISLQGSGLIYRSGTGLLNMSAGTTSISGGLINNLDGSITTGSATFGATTGDYTLQQVTADTVTIDVPTGAVIDGNGSTTNVIANNLIINAATGIGSSDAIETIVKTLDATSAGSGNIQITNTGNLVASVTHSGTGGLTLVNYGGLQANSISVPAGAISVTAYGRLSLPDITTTGNINATSYGAAVLGNLSGAALDLRDNGGGGLTAATINATSAVSALAYGNLQLGAINAGSYVNLDSYGGSVSVSGVTATSNYIDIVSRDSFTLAGTLTAPSSINVQVQKPGGMVTMLSGSAISDSSGSGNSVTLRADDMVLGGSINAGSGYVYLSPYSQGRDIRVATDEVAGALNLSPAELQTITGGSLEIGTYYSYGGKLTVASALTTLDLNVNSLSLEGATVTTGDLGVNSNLELYGRGSITTGNLSGSYIYLYNYGHGDVTTGTITSTDSVYLYSDGGHILPGAINAGGYVQVQAYDGRVTLPNITSTGSSIYVYSLEDLTLTSTLSAAYGVDIQVRRPGGVFTMASGSSITGNTQTTYYSLDIRADEMVLGGTIDFGTTGYVYLSPYWEGRNINIGLGTVAGALNLAPAELSTITAGQLDIGSYYNYYGSGLTVSSPIVATDLNVGRLNLYGNTILLGGSIAINGDLGIYSQADLDANTTASTLTLSATGNLALVSYDGQIYRSGTGVTDVVAATTNIDAPLGIDLGGSTSGGDVTVTWDQGDYSLSTLTATNLTLNVTNGGIVDTNGSAVNITAGSVTLNASNGIGDGDPIDTAIGTLAATTGGTGNIEINNTGNLTINNVTHSGTGSIILTNAGSLTLGTATTTGGSFTANVTGALTLSGNISGAPSVQLTSGGAIGQTSGGITTSSLVTSSVGGTLLSGSNSIASFSATNTGGGDILLYSSAPLLTAIGISQSGGGSVTLRANDLALSGPIVTDGGLVSLAPLAPSGNMYVGNVTGAGLQLSEAELFQIDSTNIEFGRSDGTGTLDIALSPTTLTSGTLRFLAGGGVNVAGGPYTVQGGLFEVPGTLNLLGAAVDVPGGIVNIGSGGSSSSTAGTVNIGSLHVSSGTMSADTVNVGSGGVLDATGSFLTAGSLNILSGGTLMGNGTLTGNVNNSGTVAPGASPGTLMVSGDYVQTATGILAVEVGGATAGSQYDQLIVNGNVTLGGNLNTTLIGGYAPAPGQSYTFISSSGTISGSFVNVTQPPSLQTPVAAASPTTSTSQLMVTAAGSPTAAPAPVVVTTQAEVTSSTITTQETLQNDLAQELELIQSLAIEPTGATKEEEDRAKKPPACG